MIATVGKEEMAVATGSERHASWREGRDADASRSHVPLPVHGPGARRQPDRCVPDPRAPAAPSDARSLAQARSFSRFCSPSCASASPGRVRPRSAARSSYPRRTVLTRACS
jgi:hypothetical protein